MRRDLEDFWVQEGCGGLEGPNNQVMGVNEGPEAGVLEAAGAGDHRTAVVPGPEVHWG